MQFIESPNKYNGRKAPLRVIVWHDMEAPENSTTAEAVARYFSHPSTQASAHLCADSNSVVECVKPEDTAWHAPGANSDGYGIELAGYARQTADEWLDDFSKATIHNAAVAVAPVMKEHGIPARWLTDAELADGKTKGMTTHRQVTRVFHKSTHTDPGAHFCYDYCQNEVRAALGITQGRKPSIPNEHTCLGVGDKAAVEQVQDELNRLTYHCTVDGDFGPKTEEAVKAFQRHAGIEIDGLVGPETRKALSDALSAAQSHSPATPTEPAPSKPAEGELVVDGDLGPKTISRWQEIVGTPVDGVISKPRSALIERVQKILNGWGAGLKRDGDLGPNTTRALQKYLGVRQDGALGPETVKALQRRLNTGKF